jgi:hypothetical protein
VQSPFKSAWWSFDLGKYRPCSGTYQRYAAESVPPVDARRFTGDFAWLRPARGRAGAARTPAFIAAASQRGVALPAALVRFMSEPALRAAVPSCTACEWDPSSAPVPCRVVPGAFTFRVLRDQQDCLFWYLHLLPDGDAQVLCSPIPFDDPALDVSPETVIAHTWWVAPDLETFVYRFWIENQIWDQLSSSDPDLTPEQRDYLDHYSPGAKRARKHLGKVAIRRAKKATAPRPIKRTAAARLAAERQRQAKTRRSDPIGGAMPR